MRWLLLALCSALLAAPAWAGQKAGAAAQDFTLPDLAGGTVKLSELRGKIVILDFWASWCEPCMQELPALDRLQREFGPRGVVVLAVNIDKDRQNAQAAVDRLKLGVRVALDAQGSVAERYDPGKMPTSYVLDRSGVVRYVHEGYEGNRDAMRLRRELDELSR